MVPGGAPAGPLEGPWRAPGALPGPLGTDSSPFWRSGSNLGKNEVRTEPQSHNFVTWPGPPNPSKMVPG